MLNEWPKVITVGGQRVRAENADHERALLGGQPYRDPAKPTPAPVMTDHEYPKVLTHPDSGERVVVNSRDEEFHLRRFASEFQARSVALPADDPFAISAAKGRETPEPDARQAEEAAGDGEFGMPPRRGPGRPPKAK